MATVGRCQRLDRVLVAQGAQSRSTAISAGTRCSDVHRGPPSKATSGDLTAARVEAAGEVVAQGLSSRRSAVAQGRRGKQDSWPCPKTYNPLSAWQLVRKTDNRVRAVRCPTFTSGLSRKSGRAASASSPW